MQLQVAGPSSPDTDVLQARAEVAEGEVKMLRNNMKHARKVNEQLQVRCLCHLLFSLARAGRSGKHSSFTNASLCSMSRHWAASGLP